MSYFKKNFLVILVILAVFVCRGIFRFCGDKIMKCNFPKIFKETLFSFTVQNFGVGENLNGFLEISYFNSFFEEESPKLSQC